MVRHKHNKSKRLHIPLTIEYRGKADSAYIECSCGYVDLVATWNFKNRWPGMTQDRWENLRFGVAFFLNAIHP